MARLEFNYFTDVFCSWCWAAEPTLEKVLLAYPEQIEFHYKTYPLFEQLDEVRFHPLGLWGIADRWRVVSKKTGVSLDPRLWDEDPPQSAWPAALAIKAAAQQGEERLHTFVRLIRAAAMTERKNVTRREILLAYADKAGLHLDRFAQDLDDPARVREVEADIREAEGLGIDARPAFVMTNAGGDRVVVTGLRAFALFRQAIETLLEE